MGYTDTHMKTTTAFIIIVVLAIAGYLVYSSTEHNEANTSTGVQQQNTEQTTSMEQEWNTSATGLGIQIVKAGTGPAAQVGDTVVVHYTGTLTDGTKFDSSVDRGEPFAFRLGDQMVIAGWEQGILGMQVGEQRKLNIPSDLAYGPQGRPPVIPPSATLLFDVELLDIQ